MKNKLRLLLEIPIIIYMLNSVIVGLLDTIIVWILYRLLQLDLVAANTIGVVTGSVIHYCISSKSVFRAKLGVMGFLIYFGTFLLGLMMADFLIYIGDHYIFTEFGKDLRFLMSKAFSVLLPFFVLYFLRRQLFKRLSARAVTE